MFNINKKKEIGNITLVNNKSVNNLIAYYYIQNFQKKVDEIKYIEYNEYQNYCRNNSIDEILS